MFLLLYSFIIDMQYARPTESQILAVIRTDNLNELYIMVIAFQVLRWALNSLGTEQWVEHVLTFSILGCTPIG